jgi:hypothetical protein
MTWPDPLDPDSVRPPLRPVWARTVAAAGRRAADSTCSYRLGWRVGSRHRSSCAAPARRSPGHRQTVDAVLLAGEHRRLQQDLCDADLSRVIRSSRPTLLSTVAVSAVAPG